ncbi:hypothetical protein MiSe_14080 [Microseira wollei NIES-4236]|uniref:Uncharacterized protein n=2 Tax=Microseira wollei TaxID=467598 RepID=A0AAV3X7P9_9CYAN|nr:hypothetical protein MiSe_14080 [Microseira wollei NIES-4236]
MFPTTGIFHWLRRHIVVGAGQEKNFEEAAKLTDALPLPPVDSTENGYKFFLQWVLSASGYFGKNSFPRKLAMWVNLGNKNPQLSLAGG